MGNAQAKNFSLRDEDRDRWSEVKEKYRRVKELDDGEDVNESEVFRHMMENYVNKAETEIKLNEIENTMMELVGMVDDELDHDLMEIIDDKLGE